MWNSAKVTLTVITKVSKWKYILRLEQEEKIFTPHFSLQKIPASFSVGGNSYNLGNTINLRLEPQQCQDISGRVVNHGSHYVPTGLDNCKMCVCDNGSPKVTQLFSCWLQFTDLFIHFYIISHVGAFCANHQLAADLSKWHQSVVNFNVSTRKNMKSLVSQLSMSCR